jgi:hypothetical protein
MVMSVKMAFFYGTTSQKTAIVILKFNLINHLNKFTLYPGTGYVMENDYNADK